MTPPDIGSRLPSSLPTWRALPPAPLFGAVIDLDNYALHRHSACWASPGILETERFIPNNQNEQFSLLAVADPRQSAGDLWFWNFSAWQKFHGQATDLTRPGLPKDHKRE